MSTQKTAAPPLLWWESLAEECPITLEPLRELPYPPFVLKSHDTATQSSPAMMCIMIPPHEEERKYYFDGHALASYIVSRGMFQNPLTRESLTWDDCRRLDEYLDSYIYNNHNGPSCKRFAVLEAFALRETVHIRTAARQHQQGIPTLDQAEAERRQRRAEVLRSEATAALSGLFTYGRQSGGNAAVRRHTPANIPLPQPPPPLLGFNLHQAASDRRAEYGNDEEEFIGLIVIDDDEARVVESEQQAYRQLQEAFPRLSTQQQLLVEDDQTNLVDERVEAIRRKAEVDRQNEERRQQALAVARRQLEEEAANRKQQRKEEWERIKRRASEDLQQRQREQEELQRARAEIERWRQEHWAKLQQIAELKQLEEAREGEVAQRLEQERLAEEPAKKAESSNEPAGEELEAQAAAKQQAAKAAKRKRARDRKKAQISQERALEEQTEQQAALEAKKAASPVKCAACHGGVVGCGFEKFGHTFCSTKCARMGPSS